MTSFRLAVKHRVHLVGIGGAGMSALGRILLERGHSVSGSDLRGGRSAGALVAMGAEVHIGHHSEHVVGADVVVASTAVPASNPELVRARELAVPVLRRAELLALLMEGHRRVLVAGTHGKTTTTSMVTVCLQQAHLDPSFAIGGTLHDAGTSAHHGQGEVFVAEADESDRSFLVFTPECLVVTNVELDHHDVYGGVEEVHEAFAAFLSRRADGAPAILCHDDPGAMRLADGATPPITTYGMHPDADLRISDVSYWPEGTTFQLHEAGADLGLFRLRLPGRHNVLNATAAAAVARWAGAGSDAIRTALERFSGAKRRFQDLGTAAGVSVVDDYAHHPTELHETLLAARQRNPDGRILAVFQPHRFSRTAALATELGTALASADLAVVTDVYASGETPVPGVNGELVADAVRAGGGECRFVGAISDLPDVVAGLARAGDLVLTLGAGDITEVGPLVLRRLEGRRE